MRPILRGIKDDSEMTNGAGMGDGGSNAIGDGGGGCIGDGGTQV